MRKLYKVIGLLLVSNAVFAQDTTKFVGTYQLNGIVSGGNSSRKLISTNETFVYNSCKTTLSTNLNFTYGSNNKILLEKEYFQTISYGYHLSEKSKVIIFGDLEHSNLRSISFRGSFGEGYLYKIVNTNSILFDVSEALMVERTSVKNTDSFDLFTGRLSTRIRLNVSSGLFRLAFVSLVQPSIKQFFLNDGERFITGKNNFSARTSLTVEQTLYKGVTFGLTFNHIIETYSNYLSIHTQNRISRLLPTDYNIQFGIKYTNKLKK